MKTEFRDIKFRFKFKSVIVGKWWDIPAVKIAALTPQTQDVNWTYIRRSEDVLDVFWTSYVRQFTSCVHGEIRYLSQNLLFCDI